MKKLTPYYTEREAEIIKRLKPHEIDMRIGYYFRNLEDHQKKRFNRIVMSIANRMGLKLNQAPVEVLIIRQIALNTIRIEEAELELINNPSKKYDTKIERWLINMQKERRDAITLLSTLSKVTEKKDGVDKFQGLRDIIRKVEGLGKSKKIDYNPDGHDRRHYDKITRTKKSRRAM